MYLKEKWLSGTIAQVWLKATPVPGYNPIYVRKDSCGAWMEFLAHGNRNSPYGWEIDHVFPVARGGTDVMSNLQPLHWKNNVHKGDDLRWFCALS